MTQKTFTPAIAPAIQTLHVGTLITLWVGATIANIATLMDVQVSFPGLAGGAILVGFLLLRLWQLSGLARPEARPDAPRHDTPRPDAPRPDAPRHAS